MEPWLYGSRTGLGSLAIIVSAIFWSWLWGPLGLVLSTPLTVCLVVLGRHVPQFEFLDVLLGNEPVLEPPARIYQRLLAGDPDEAADFAEEWLEDDYLADFYEKVGIPALLLAEQDRQRGVMSEERQDIFSRSVTALVADLEEIADEEESGDEPDADDAPGVDMPDGDGYSLLALGGRGALDDAAAVMLAQTLSVEGAAVERASWRDLAGARLAALPLDDAQTVVLAYLNRDSAAPARHAVRRFKRARPHLRVGLFMPALAGRAPEALAELAERANADFVAGSIAEAAKHAFSDARPVKFKAAPKRLAPRRPKAKRPEAAA